MTIFKHLQIRSKTGGRYGFVLFNLVVALIAYPLCVHLFIGRLLFHLWLVITLTQLIVSLSVDRATRIRGICLGSAPMLLAILSFAANLFDFEALIFFKVLLPLTALFLFFCSWQIVCSIFKEQQVTVDVLCGSILAYLLIGISWGEVFFCIELFAPNSFEFGIEMKVSERANQLFYFSFVTLTTLGYGDILPITGFAQTVTYLESVVGVMYPAILVATLVSSFKRQQNETIKKS